MLVTSPFAANVPSLRRACAHSPFRTVSRLPHVKCQPSRRNTLVVRADRDRGGSFATGFVVGGAIFGALGFIFAPQISNAILGENKKLKIPRFLDDESKGKLTKEDLRESIAQLNSLMDEFSAQLEDDPASKDGAVKQAART